MFKVMQDLFKLLILQHLDTIIQSVSTIVAAFLPSWLVDPLKKRKKGRQHKKTLRRGRKFSQYMKMYAEAVLQDPHVLTIQIMGMKHPLLLEDVYVPLRVHPENIYSLDPALREAEEEEHDPNLLFQAARKSLDHLVDGATEPDEAIRLYKRCVIVGNPGAGKTTLLRYLAIKSAKNELPGLPSFPLYVQLNTFNSKVHKDLFGLLLAQVSMYMHQLDKQNVHDFLREKMNEGQVLLLLDGLDETKIGIADDDAERAYITMVDAIKRLASSYPQLPIVVTVRKAGYTYRPKLQSFDELEVVDFRPEDSKAFVANWFNASQTTSKEQKIKGLTARLDRNLRMQMLASNPLILSLIAILYEGQLELPDRRADFYKQCIEQCIEMLQKKWDASRDITRSRVLSLAHQPQLLQEVAWHFHGEGKRNFPIKELLQVIGKFLPTVDLPESLSQQVLEQIALDNGLLREQTHGWYGFSHLTFQEYFVTQYIIANNLQADLLQHLNNPRWEEVLLLYVGSIHDASSLFTILLGHDENTPLQDDLFSSYLILAGRCLAEKPRIRKTSLREEVITKLFDLLQTTPYTRMREQAANTLAMIGGVKVNSRLLNLLSANDEKLLDIRERIGWAIGAFGERNLARELVIQLSHRKTSRYIRIIITHALGRLAESSITYSLLHVLSNEQEDIYVRQSIALALGVLGDKGVVPPLARLLDRKDENPLVQQSIIVALGMLGDQFVVTRLQELLANEQLDWHVRGSAAKALGMLRLPVAIPTMLQVLEDDDDNTYIRGRIATALGGFAPDILPVERLLVLLADEMLDPAIRNRIARTLGAMGKRKIVSSFLQLLANKHVNYSVRVNIVAALGYLGYHDEKVIHILNEMRAEQHIDVNLRASVTATLVLLGTKSVVYDLLEFLEDTSLSQDIVLYIIYALARFGEHNNTDKRDIACKLVELLSSQNIDRYRGQNMVGLLCTLGERAVVPSLLDLLAQSAIDSDIRQHIADVLAQIAGDSRTLGRLNDILASTDIADSVFSALWSVNRRVKSGGSA